MKLAALLKELALPLVLITETFLCLKFGHMLSVDVKSALYAISLTIKDLLLFGLPFLIFSFISASLGNLQKGAISFIVIAFVLVVTSNFLGAFLAGVSGMTVLKTLGTIQPFATDNQTLSPLWDLPIPQLISNDVALIIGLIFGITTGHLQNDQVIRAVNKTRDGGLLILKKVFVPIIPIFVLGFILKMDYEGVLDVIIDDYLSVFVAITILAYSYITVLFGLAVGFRPSKWRRSIQRMIPAVVTGFSTMSSASALPLIITASEKTTRNPIVSGVVPLSINIHMLGDCFSITILALAILTSFGMPIPSPSEFMIYLAFFTLVRFSAAAVPGGGVIVVLPILESYLNFSPEMLSLILALYILFDPIATSANVFGNGAFAMIFEKLYNWRHPVEKPDVSLS